MVAKVAYIIEVKIKEPYFHVQPPINFLQVTRQTGHDNLTIK